MALTFLFTGCSGQKAGNDSTEDTTERAESSNADHQFPSELAEIPDEYMSEADQQGQLKDLYYDTYESKTYDQKTTKLRKHAVVYLPYGYSEDQQYNVFYLMHGG